MPNNSEYKKSTANTDKWKEWYLKNTGNEYQEGTAFSRIEGLTDKQNEIGNNLYNAYINESALNNQFDIAQKDIARQQSIGEQQAAITLERLKKYLPTALKQQGLSGLGVSQSAYIDAENAYQNEMSALRGETNAAQNELMANYFGNVQEISQSAQQGEQSIYDKYFPYEEANRTEAYETALIKYDEIKNSNLTDGKLTEKGKEEIIKYLDNNKEAMGIDNYNKIIRQLESENVISEPDVGKVTNKDRFTNKSTPLGKNSAFISGIDGKSAMANLNTDSPLDYRNFDEESQNKIKENPFGQIFKINNKLYYAWGEKLFEISQIGTEQNKYQNEYDAILAKYTGTYYDLDK